MTKKQGLGRGLGAIFEENSVPESGRVTTLRISDIEPNKDQPRKQFETEALTQLANSISEHGVLQPILVRESTSGIYEIIAGERRWRASRMAGLTEIPAIIVEADEMKAAQISLIENIQRENLSPFEEAKAYESLMYSFGMSQEEVAAKLGKSRSAVANTVRLLDLPEDVALLVGEGQLTAGHARALLGLKDKSGMLKLANRIIAKNLSVRETEAAVKRENKALLSPKETEQDDGKLTVDYNAVLEEKVKEKTGRRVKIVNTRNKKTVQIEFADNADLEELLAVICGGAVEI